MHRPEVEALRELPSFSRTSLVLLTPIHFDITLTMNNFTSEAEDPICPLFISKETPQCIKCSITL